LHRNLARLSSPATALKLLAVITYFLITLAPVLGLAVDLLANLAGTEPTAAISSRAWRLLGNSVFMAAAVAGLSTLIGFGASLWLVTGSGLFRHWLSRMFLIPLLIPSYLYALTWITVFSRQGMINRLLTLAGIPPIAAYGPWATILALAVIFVPIIMLMVLPALRTMPAVLVESARILVADSRVWWRVIIPLACPVLVSAGGLVFALAMVNYSVPALLQFNVYTMEIFAEFSQSGDPLAVMALAVPLAVPVVGLSILAQLAWKKTPLIGDPKEGVVLRGLPQPVILRFWGQAAAVLLAMSIAVPVLVLLVQAASLHTIWQAVVSAAPEIRLSLELALSVGILSALIAWPSAQLLTNWRGGRWFWYVIPLAIPGPLLGIGLIHMWNTPLGAGIYGRPIMLILAHAGCFLPYAVFAQAIHFRRLDPLLYDAASLHAVGWHRRFFQVQLRLRLPGLLGAVGLVAALSLGEIGVSLLIMPPGQSTLSLRLFNLMHYGASDVVAGLSLAVLGLIGGIGSVVFLLGRKWHI